MNDATSAADPVDRRPARVADVLWLAVCGAQLAALGHFLYVQFLLHVLHVFTFTNREFAWLAMVGYLVCFLVVAVPVAVAARLMRRLFSVQVVGAIFASLGLFALLLLTQKLHPVAQLLLAVGLGVQVARLLFRNPADGMRRVRVATVVAVLALGTHGALAYAAPRLQERWMTTGDVPETGRDAPNIILLILDTVRAANLSVYGYDRPTTPNLERMAAEGTVFLHAFATAPWTAPSHASMMTGLWASETQADYLQSMVDSVTTVSEVLTSRGYVAGGFMANTGYAGHQLGISRGFTHFEDFPLSFLQAMLSTTFVQTRSGQQLLDGVRGGGLWKIRRAITQPDLRTDRVRTAEPQSAATIAHNFFAWRDGIPARPYFAMLNFMDAHAPYEPPDGFRTRFNEGRRELDAYDGGIAYEDSIIGTIVRRLEERGDLENTVLIITSDHGEQFGEHGLGSHGNSLYLPLLHVPLIVRAPGRAPAGQRVATIVTLRDLAATLVDLGGAPAGTMPGVSLAGAWRSGSNAGLSPVMAEVSPAINPAPRNPTRRGPIKSMIDSTWHYVRFGDGVEELYAWQSDSAELENRAGTAAGMVQSRDMRERIAETLGIRWPGTRVGRY
ncbi:MAG: sulfatase [Gemmatimonadaceae bacterium]